ncbi:hypothetical protein QE441_001013 [Chryseobacterium sp. SORGH_AS909]|uniref:Uncharacterized protein n=1 Tax=Chryseobacterium camelliae TaxID=1265445 RepID=A0ABU0TM30_9FLAO|nr:hypothetical protein [Chryseobacterium camelliae]MDQ1101780.1 hypothetical protein [Chryseobacterium sp. SORGH_AS_1048]MDR6085219.1 hypothetical protein [Chryseobacterium sp. SORGH_AS_0909]MDR6129577.1 hypothetical protein [Chryseobacterium sp. SORGH_AS_1175]
MHILFSKIIIYELIINKIEGYNKEYFQQKNRCTIFGQ